MKKYRFFKILHAECLRGEATIIFSCLEKSSPLSKNFLHYMFLKTGMNNYSYVLSSDNLQEIPK